MVEIIPKEKQVTSSQNNILFYIALIIFVLAIGGYFVFIFLINQSQNQITTLKTELEKQKTPEVVSLEKDILALQKKINDFSVIFPRHISVFDFFQLLENKTHPDIYFYSLTLSSSEFRAQLFGRAKSFNAIDQQIQLFKKEKLVDTLDLTTISLNKQGEVEFTLDLTFDAQFFKPYEQF